EKSMSRFCGASAIARPTSSSGCGVIPSSPGSVCSIVPLSTASFLVHLLCPSDRQCARGNILCDHGAGCNPCVVAVRRGGEDCISDPILSFAGGRGALFHTGVLLVRGDVPRCDVRV